MAEFGPQICGGGTASTMEHISRLTSQDARQHVLVAVQWSRTCSISIAMRRHMLERASASASNAAA